jgi:uncharacterized membrane protein affecting hemolysin expression
MGEPHTLKPNFTHVLLVALIGVLIANLLFTSRRP